jgi:hypothetical protein
LDRELINTRKNVEGFIIAITVFTNACIALVGIPPGPMNTEFYEAFHAFVTIVGFLGLSIHIVFYSIMMYRRSKSIVPKGPIFKNYLFFLGIFIGGLFIIYLITQYYILEWIVGALIVFWVLITTIQCFSFKKLYKTLGEYRNKSQDHKLLQAIQGINLDIES